MQTYDIPEGDKLKRVIRSAVEEAIYDVLGGPVKAAELLNVSRQAVHAMLDNAPIRNRAAALRVERATGEAGCKVPAAELMQLVPWLGPERHDPTSRARRRRPSTAPAQNRTGTSGTELAAVQAAANGATRLILHGTLRA